MSGTEHTVPLSRTGPLRAVYEFIAMYGGLTLLGFLCILWSVIAVVLLPLLPEAMARSVGRHVITFAVRSYLGTMTLTGICRFDLTALDALADEGALIIAPNHPCLLDAFLVMSRLPVTCIMKAELTRNLFLGAPARLAGYICNDTARCMIRRSVASLESGTQLLVFPEGTRTTRRPVNAFTGSIGTIARKANVPVQAVFIDADSPYLSKGWPLFRRPAFPIAYRIRLGRRFDPSDKSHDFIAELEAYFAEELGRGSRMNEWLPESPPAGAAPDP